jgi:hypothetical protein
MDSVRFWHETSGRKDMVQNARNKTLKLISGGKEIQTE